VQTVPGLRLLPRENERCLREIAGGGGRSPELQSGSAQPGAHISAGAHARLLSLPANLARFPTPDVGFRSAGAAPLYADSNRTAKTADESSIKADLYTSP
jgi:hypothetical protein